MKFKIFGIEMHASHSCNLSCAFCAHYSNYISKMNNVPVRKANLWMQAWSKRLELERFSILGGEPCLNPELCEYVKSARRNWGKTKIHVVTNGFLLHRHPDLPKVLKESEPSRLVVSRHHYSKEYMDKYNEAINLAKRWRDKWGIELELQQGIEQWRRTYVDLGKNMKPYNDDPQKSFAACKMKNSCRNLYNYNLYKCAPLTYLPMTAEKLSLGKEWDFYKNYTPLSPNCSDEELKEWISVQAIPECAMCPSKFEYTKDIPNPMYADPSDPDSTGPTQPLLPIIDINENIIRSQNRGELPQCRG